MSKVVGFTRCDFTQLHFRNGQIDFQRLKIGDRLWKTDDPALNRQLRQTFARDPEPARALVDIEVSGRSGGPLRLRVVCGDRIVEASSELKLSPARKAALTGATLHEQLSRLGGTRYALRNFEVTLEDNLFIPLGCINHLRREAIARLDAAMDAPSDPCQGERPGALVSLITRRRKSCHPSLEARSASIGIWVISPSPRFTKRSARVARIDHAVPKLRTDRSRPRGRN